MAKSNYINASDDGFAHQLVTFKDAVGAYAAPFGLTPAQLLAQANDADYFTYSLECQQLMQNGSKQWTAWKDLTRAGGTPPSAIPQPPTFPPSLPTVAPGVEVRFRTLVKQIKANSEYNESIGQALGIEGSQKTGP